MASKVSGVRNLRFFCFVVKKANFEAAKKVISATAPLSIRIGSFIKDRLSLVFDDTFAMVIEG